MDPKHLNNHLRKSMEQVADISAAGQEIPQVLQDPKNRCHVDKNLILLTHPEWDQSSSRPSTRFL
jgi:hypothetical protein